MCDFAWVEGCDLPEQDFCPSLDEFMGGTGWCDSGEFCVEKPRGYQISFLLVTLCHIGRCSSLFTPKMSGLVVEPTHLRKICAVVKLDHETPSFGMTNKQTCCSHWMLCFSIQPTGTLTYHLVDLFLQGRAVDRGGFVFIG